MDGGVGLYDMGAKKWDFLRDVVCFISVFGMRVYLACILSSKSKKKWRMKSSQYCEPVSIIQKTKFLGSKMTVLKLKIIPYCKRLNRVGSILAVFIQKWRFKGLRGFLIDILIWWPGGFSMIQIKVLAISERKIYAAQMVRLRSLKLQKTNY